MRRLSAQILASVALFALAANNGLAAVPGSPADRCLAHLREVAESKSFYWAWTYPWFAHNEFNGDARFAVERDGAILPKHLEETRLETPAWREEAKLEQRFGILPKFYYQDLCYVTGSWRSSQFYARNRATLTSVIRKAWKDYGAVCVFSWHMDHPCVTNGFNAAPYRYTCSEHKNVVKAILNDEQWPCGAGSVIGCAERSAPSPRAWFIRQLEEVAAFFNGLTDERGEKIPVILRYAHEMDGGWFWWGKDACTKEEFIAISRIEAKCLRKRCGDGQILFAYTPDRWWGGLGEEGKGSCNYLTWYPGDAYVDILGYDDYAIGGGKTPEERQKNFDNALAKMRMMSEYAAQRGKAVILSESGNPDSGFFYADLYRLMTAEGVHAAVANTWIGPWTWPKTQEGMKDLEAFVVQPKVKIIKATRKENEK